jgi:CheY-like chemotaxis protein
VARRIGGQPQLQQVVLVAQTGRSQDEDRRRSQEAGFDHHLVKPIDVDVLRQIIASVTPPASSKAEPDAASDRAGS